MEFAVLGPVRFRLAGGEVTAPLQRHLLGLLILSGDAPVAPDSLCEALWPDAADDLLPRLRLHVHRLRKALGDADRLSLEPAGYRLRLQPGELDAELFGTLRARGLDALAAGRFDEAVQVLREADGLWRGEPYDGLGGEPAFEQEAARLREMRLSALERLYAAELRLGTAAVAEVADLAAAYPLREGFHALHMAALAREGRQAEALEVYRRVRNHLVDELGIEPGPGLRRIEAAVLAGDDGPDLLDGGAEQVRQPLVVPAQLPPAIAHLVGRDRELAEIFRCADAGRQVVVLTGIAGVGKTGLAVTAAHRLRDRFPDGQLFVDLRSFSSGDTVRTGHALASFLTALGVPADEIPTGDDERAALYRSVLAERRMLVVLDNAGEAAQVRPMIPAAPGVLTVVTSRDELRGLTVSHDPARIEVRPFDSVASHALLRQMLGDRVMQEADAAAVLADLCGGLPLSLRVVAANAAPGSASMLGDLVNELASVERLARLVVEGDAEADVGRSFDHSYSALDQPAQDLFRAAGVLPGASFAVEAVASVAGVPLADARRGLGRLAAAHLVEARGSGRYGMHDLLRLYARDQIGRGAELTAIQRVVGWYAQSAVQAYELLRGAPFPADRLLAAEPGCVPARFDDPTAGLDWLDREWPAIVTVLDLVVDPSVQAQRRLLLHALYPYLETRRTFEDHAELYGAALASAREAGDPVEVAELVNLLGNAHSLAGRPEESLTCYREYLDLVTELGDENRRARALGNLGVALNLLGRFTEAIPVLRETLTLFRAHGDQRKEVSGLGILSLAYTRAGQPGEGLTAADQAISLAENSGPVTLAFLASNRGEALLGLGDVDAAVDVLGDAVDQLRTLKVVSTEAEVTALLARALRSRGDLDAAARHTRVVLELCQSLPPAEAARIRASLAPPA